MSHALSSARESPPQGFAPGSPRALWIERVKAAKASDFRQLIAEWENAFPYDERYDHGITPNAETALRWAYGMWIVKDFDGFMQFTNDGSFYSQWAAETMVELMPETAAALLSEPASPEPHRYFISAISSALAEQHPLLYLQWNPDAILEIEDNHSTSDDWITAITQLAKTDAVAAGNACLRWKVENHSRGIFEALKAVAAGWKPSDPPIADWANGIADPRLRNFATHAWLSVMAEHDPHAALKALDTTKLEQDNGLESATETIVIQLAKSDPLAALKLLKETEDFFAQDTSALNDPFAESNVAIDPFAESVVEEDPPEEEPEKPTNPFSDIFSGRIYSGSGLSDNLMSFSILQALAEKLPSDPEGLIAGIRALNSGVGGDAAWQRDIEARMISNACARWSVEDCMKAVASWTSNSSSTEEEAVLLKLATQAAEVDPEMAFSQMSHFPEQVRSVLLRKVILNIPATDKARRTELLRQLPAEQWNSEIGRALGAQATEYASMIAEMPFDPSNEVLDAFTNQWGDEHPEAAAAWINALPNEEAAASAAAGLAASWFFYDRDAASVWADSLPPGSIRDEAMKKRNLYIKNQSDSQAPMTENSEDPFQ